MDGRVGYEYRYRFWMEDEIIKRCKFEPFRGMKSFLFEIATNFIIQRRADEGGVDEILDSERFEACVMEKDVGESLLYFLVDERMKEYWMSDDEVKRLSREAFDFARQMAADPQHASLRVIPVVVGVEVRTVQQEGEPLVSTIGRAIRAHNLIPIYFCSVQKLLEMKPKMTSLLTDYLRKLPRIRVVDVDEGLALMQTCGICLRNPTIGAQISSLPCDHAFHSHCVVKYLETNNFCPLCHSPAHVFPYLEPGAVRRLLP